MLFSELAFNNSHTFLYVQTLFLFLLVGWIETIQRRILRPIGNAEEHPGSMDKSRSGKLMMII